MRPRRFRSRSRSAAPPAAVPGVASVGATLAPDGTMTSLVEDALRVTPAEAAQLDEALDEEPWEIPELAELVREVEAQRKYAGRLRPRRPPAP